MFGQLIPFKKIPDKTKWCNNSFEPKNMKTSMKTSRQSYKYGFSCALRLFSTDSRIVKK